MKWWEVYRPSTHRLVDLEHVSGGVEIRVELVDDHV